MTKYFIEIQTERIYEHTFEAETDAEAEEYLDNYVIDDKDLMYTEVTQITMAPLSEVEISNANV